MKRIILFVTLLIILVIPTIKVNAVDISELICDHDNVYDIKKKSSNMNLEKIKKMGSILR